MMGQSSGTQGETAEDTNFCHGCSYVRKYGFILIAWTIAPGTDFSHLVP